MKKLFVKLIQNPLLNLLAAVQESVLCFGLGLRDGMRPKIALTSICIGFVASMSWLVIFIVWYRDIQWLTMLLAFKLVFTYIAVHFPMLVGHGVVPTTVGIVDPLAMVTGILTAGFGSIIAAIIGFVLVALVYIAVVMATMRIALELCFIDRIKKQCLMRYPELATNAHTSLRGNLRNMLGAIMLFVFGSIFCFIVPVIGGILFFLLASYLNVRSLVNDVLEDVATSAEIRCLIQANRIPMIFLGVLVSLFMLVPVIGFFAPGVLGASVCHFCMREISTTSRASNLRTAA